MTRSRADSLASRSTRAGGVRALLHNKGEAFASSLSFAQSRLLCCFQCRRSPDMGTEVMAAVIIVAAVITVVTGVVITVVTDTGMFTVTGIFTDTCMVMAGVGGMVAIGAMA
jgi:hypothetical protein